MKISFALIIVIIFIILGFSLFYLTIIQKGKNLDNQIENERKLNHNLKVFLKSKLSIFNLSKIFHGEELRQMDEDDLIILEKKEDNKKSNEPAQNDGK